MAAAPARHRPAGAVRYGGCGMKQFGRCFVLCCLFAALLSQTALANSAPPDHRVAVKVVNGPEELYYLDLLEQSEEEIEIYKREGMDPELLEAMKEAAPDGWQPYTISMAQRGNHFSGDLAGENGMHVFHGWDTPEIFRILIVTKSGERWVSEPMEREVLNSSVKVDWKAGTARITPKWISVGAQFLSTLLPTLVIEGLFLIAFGLASKRNWLVFLIVNLVTQGVLSAVLANPLAQGGFRMVPFYLIFLIPAELLIAAIEANIYRYWFRGQTSRRAFWYGFAANGASYALGWTAVNLVWAGLISL